ncbi:Growth inhibitor [Candidatus Burkholderia verschuerenii]|uniref:Growth inhibitor n=1 Tax=Candidatus Burkholderia verschuerenii TaxID=242163 RepID=A0A0L0MHR0_9BURK|nr:type II toxin-antitoxin system PemK/MazF family toxin [Candidatus Burkholderia verschuerenii]KND61499.1 Growth inhibitor [Candidatus Burkholderia verschuerenii]
MKRGDLVTISVSGDYGKPRPALVVQADVFAVLPSVTVLQLTSEIHDEHLVRITVQPSAGNCLRKPSQVMIDRAMTVPCTKVGPVFGRLDDTGMLTVSRALVWFFGLDGLAA